MARSTKTNFLDQLIGVKEPTVETMEHSQVLKQNLEWTVRHTVVCQWVWTCITDRDLWKQQQ